MPPSKHKVGKLTLERLEAGAIWQKDLSEDRWFIQIFSTTADRHAEIEALLRRMASREIEMSKLHVYYSDLSGSPRYGIVYGDYPTRSAAVAAMRGLPDPLLANKPYPRKVLRLR